MQTFCLHGYRFTYDEAVPTAPVKIEYKSWGQQGVKSVYIPPHVLAAFAQHMRKVQEFQLLKQEIEKDLVK